MCIFLSVVFAYLISLVAYEFLNVNIVGRKGTCETCELFGFERKISDRGCYKRRYCVCVYWLRFM